MNLNRTLNHIQQANLWFACVVGDNTVARNAIMDTLCADLELDEADALYEEISDLVETAYDENKTAEANAMKCSEVIADFLLQKAKGLICG